MTDTQSTTEPTIAEIKDALRYAIKVALAGKLELSVPEAHTVMQNLANCEAIAKGLSDNAVIFTPPIKSVDIDVDLEALALRADEAINGDDS